MGQQQTTPAALFVSKRMQLGSFFVLLLWRAG
jgi:hypothetical protein